MGVISKIAAAISAVIAIVGLVFILAFLMLKNSLYKGFSMWFSYKM